MTTESVVKTLDRWFRKGWGWVTTLQPEKRNTIIVRIQEKTFRITVEEVKE